MTTFGVYEVQNASSKQFLPEVVAEVRDGSGKLLAVNDAQSICSVTAAPGSFSFATFHVTAPASVSTPPTVSVQGYQFNDRPVYFPAISGLTFSKTGDTVTATGTIKNTAAATLMIRFATLWFGVLLGVVCLVIFQRRFGGGIELAGTENDKARVSETRTV